MSWVKQSDTLWRDYNFTKLTDGAQALWHRANSWIADQLADGCIPESAIKSLNTRRRYIDELEAAGYWERQSSGGWLAVGWQEIIEPKAKVLARRTESIQRANKSRAAHVRERCAPPGPGPLSSVNQAAETKTSVPALKPPVTSTAAAPPSPAGRGSRLIHEATLVEWHPVAKKHRDALAALGAKPDAEWRIAGEVLRQESLKPGVAQKVLNPDHILAHWHLYSSGQAPGSRLPLKLAANDAPAPRYREL